MPELNADQMPIVAAALIRLRRDTLSAIAEATAIRASNLSVWLRGKEQVISAKRIAGLLYHLGIDGRRLRGDILHRWHDTGLLTDTKTVFEALVISDAPTWLFQDSQPALTKTCFIQTGDAWLCLEITSSANAIVDLPHVTSAQRVLTFRTPLANVPTGSLQAARDALLAMAEQTAIDVGDQEMLDGLMIRLSELAAADLVSNTASPSGWKQLDDSLRFAIQLGVQPGLIAKLIADHFRPAAGTKPDVKPSPR